ncbi:hypothetical protein [Burkholderia plantarii]|uniref:hypothetical protein n=1 Tax=Burkholderia plantarii TaxID=41899 RepID=UPI000AB62BE7|nr:hypothetical protein [Burkholderia plantarii]GLZ22867.1 hypothetical protein Bpla01_63960 [Burkholderia plantarii]
MENLAITDAIVNDTEYLYSFTLHRADTEPDWKPLTLSLLSINYAVMGALPFPDSSKIPLFGLSMGIFGVAYTVATWLDPQIFGTGGAAGILSPGRSVPNETVSIWSNNALALMRMRIDPHDSTIVVLERIKGISAHDSGHLYLSRMLKERDWKPVLQLSADAPLSLVTNSLFWVPGFHPNNEATGSAERGVNLIKYNSGDWFRYPQGIENNRVLQYSFNDWTKNLELRFDKNFDGAFIAAPTPRSILPAPQGAGQYDETAVVEYTKSISERCLILRLKGYIITDVNDGEQKNLSGGSAGGQLDVLTRIKDDSPYNAYSWGGPGQVVNGYRSFTAMNIVRAPAAFQQRMFVYIPVSSEEPFLRQRRV